MTMNFYSNLVREGNENQSQRITHRFLTRGTSVNPALFSLLSDFRGRRRVGQTYTRQNYTHVNVIWYCMKSISSNVIERLIFIILTRSHPYGLFIVSLSSIIEPPLSNCDGGPVASRPQKIQSVEIRVKILTW